jgi:hypothetical protein
MVAAAKAKTRASVFRSLGINKINIPAIMGVRTITLRIGNCMVHLKSRVRNLDEDRTLFILLTIK